MRRSLRRGAVLGTVNRVDRDIVTLMIRWRTKEGARGADPGLGRWQTYTQVRSLIPELKLYSQAHRASSEEGGGGLEVLGGLEC